MLYPRCRDTLFAHHLQLTRFLPPVDPLGALLALAGNAKVRTRHECDYTRTTQFDTLMDADADAPVDIRYGDVDPSCFLLPYRYTAPLMLRAVSTKPRVLYTVSPDGLFAVGLHTLCTSPDANKLYGRAQHLRLLRTYRRMP